MRAQIERTGLHLGKHAAPVTAVVARCSEAAPDLYTLSLLLSLACRSVGGGVDDALWLW